MPELDLAAAALVLVLGTTAVWSYRAFKVNLPSSLTPFAVAWGGGAVLGAIALVQGTERNGMAISAIVVGCLLLFLLATGRQKSGPGVIAVGDRIPDFSAPDENGEIFQISSLSGSPLLLKFFRGHW